MAIYGHPSGQVENFKFMQSITLNAVKLQFAEDVREGLSRYPKKLSSKYFYDSKGDELFQQIMAMPEYYLTDAEMEIMHTHKERLRECFGEQPFDLIELGAGDGLKTQVLLEHLVRNGNQFRYLPIDISSNILQELRQKLQDKLPSLEVRPLVGDYFKNLGRLPHAEGAPRIVLFLGANIGNMRKAEACQFLQGLGKHLVRGDRILIGFDLKKDPQIILNAYNDEGGITRDFNLNLLHRINRELGGNFNLGRFMHWETYNPVSGDAKSFLISKADQSVYIEALEQSFHFAAWEAIQTELSKKYSPEEIDALAATAGFRPLQNFFDDRRYFVDVLWEWQG